jgi:hypothetical protein
LSFYFTIGLVLWLDSAYDIVGLALMLLTLTNRVGAHPTYFVKHDYIICIFYLYVLLMFKFSKILLFILFFSGGTIQYILLSIGGAHE